MTVSADRRETAYVGLGSNLGAPQGQLRSALGMLGRLPHTTLAARSGFYRTAPIGYLPQPDFVNAVACLSTGLGPRELLDALLGIEQRHGRCRGVPNGPRTLDLDLLLYGDRFIDEPGLVVPHPRMAERGFVVVPLAEIAPDLVLPAGPAVGPLAERLAAAQRVERIGADAVA